MERSLPSATILLVDDVDTCRVTTKWFLESLGFTVDSVRSAEEALAQFNPAVHRLLITDNSMPGLTGAGLAHIIKQRSPSTPIIMYTGTPPKHCACVDLILRRPVHLLKLKESLDSLGCRPDLDSTIQAPPVADSVEHPASSPDPVSKNPSKGHP